MPDGIDALVETMEPAVRQPQLDRALAKANSPELGASDRSVLPSRQLRDGQVRRSFLQFPPTMGVSRRTVGHGAMMVGANAPRCRERNDSPAA
jgi:hypothetical protein